MATSSTTTTEEEEEEGQPEEYESKTTKKYTGKVKWLDTQGVGYIISDDHDSKELLITPSSYGSRTIREGDRVQFRVMERNSIPTQKAVDVVRYGPQCYSCSEFGHFANSCPQRRNLDHINCYRCGIKGHYARDCDQILPRKPPHFVSSGFLNPYGSISSSSSSTSSSNGGGKKGSFVCVKRREDVKKVEQVEDCFILDFDPYDTHSDDDDDDDDDEEEEEEEDEDDDDCREIGSVVCVKRREDVKKVEEEEECFILEFDPSDPVKFSNLSLCAPKTEPITVEEDVSILAENGQVACRDYPHPRHLCAIHPFSKTFHEIHCKLCYCYVCDIPAPCAEWSKGSMHCDATDKCPEWRIQRDLKKSR